MITTENFRKLVETYQLDFEGIPIDTQEITRDAARRTGSQALAGGAMMNALTQFPVFQRIWQVCPKDTELLLTHALTALAHALPIGERLGIPVVGMAAVPHTTPTAEFPFCALQWPASLSALPGFNRWSYRLIHGYDWRRFRLTMNRFRTETLSLPVRGRTDFFADVQGMPIVYGFSEHLVPKPHDWPEPAYVTGFFFLDTEREWQPPAALMEFLASGAKPICISFSSMISGKNPQRQANMLAEAIRKSGQRAVVLRGWSNVAEIASDGQLFSLEAAPHDWMFKQVSAVVHHGGSGAAASTLRAGLPAVCVPHSFDQPFWAMKLAERNAGVVIPRKRLTADSLAAAIRTVTSDEAMQQSAKTLGVKIAAEDGVGKAVEIIERIGSRPAASGRGSWLGMHVGR
jgi:sterol 3beta-glucosyltransferase